ncbi:MAG: hypothetical protein HKN09_08695 [Saprospiraceae bacterium]|nr:hypothetical protein [Saprospiraceae bacterium]
MNIRKSWLFSFLLVAFLATTAFSNPNPVLNSKSVSKQFVKMLKGINLDNIETDKTIFVDFMINDKSEVIVLSTNSNELDVALKARLNYKKLVTSEMKAYTTYTLPISIKK